MQTLYNELILEIFDYLSFFDISKVYCVSNEYSKFPKLRININTHKRTLQDGTFSYLLTNGDFQLPGHIKTNHMDIRLYRYNLEYYFSFFYPVYVKDKKVFDYLKHINPLTRKIIISPSLTYN